MSNPAEQDWEFHLAFWNRRIKDVIRDSSPLLGYDIIRLWRLRLILVICFLLRDTLATTMLSAQFPLNSFALCEER